MFDMLNKRMNLTVHDVGQLIQRFLSDSLRYPQEWNDFVDTIQRKPESERYRQRCYELDPSVNRPGKVDEAAPDGASDSGRVYAEGNVLGGCQDARGLCRRYRRQMGLG
jgi:hypothetical protein